MVKVKYYGIYRASFGIEEEEIKGKTIKDVIEKIEQKYKEKEFVKTLEYAVIAYNENELLDPKRDLKFKLKPKDIISFHYPATGG